MILLLILLLLAIAFFILADRKFMDSVQRHLGPNISGFLFIIFQNSVYLIFL